MPHSVRYEVILVPSDALRTASEWTWRRFERDGILSSEGSRHDTMNACFVEIREHGSSFGEGVISVNLHAEVGGAASAAMTTVPVAALLDRVMSPACGLGKRRAHRQIALRF